MKLSHIIGLVVIALAIGIIVSSLGNSSTYVTFKEAKEMTLNNSSKAIHVVGELKKDEAGNIIGMNYDPLTNPNQFEFRMVDSLSNEALVIYNNPKPADLEKSEKVVIVGKYEKDHFAATQILLKCPSKYENKETLDGQKAVSMK
jgi:cytochrome c-type biogenesis protein CcmE